MHNYTNHLYQNLSLEATTDGMVSEEKEFLEDIASRYLLLSGSFLVGSLMSLFKISGNVSSWFLRGGS